MLPGKIFKPSLNWLLIFIPVALRAGLVDMVRASLVGAILANLLLGLGLTFLLGGLHYHSQEYNRRQAAR